MEICCTLYKIFKPIDIKPGSISIGSANSVGAVAQAGGSQDK
ncbi:MULTISPECIES: hypothetical protein [Moorena]|nr:MULTISPECIES: hypothetical protein [Moorena]